MSGSAYLIRIIEGPAEDPIELSQEVFDFLIKKGRELIEAGDLSVSSELVDFATVETCPGVDGFYADGVQLNEDEASELLGAGLLVVLRAALEELESQRD